MSSHTVIINGKVITEFITYKVRENIQYDYNSVDFLEAWEVPMRWDIMSSTYTCCILCSDEQLTFIKLAYV